MSDKKALMLDIEAEEERSYLEGKPYEKIILPYDWLDNLSFGIEIIPESLWQSSQAINMAMTLEKVQLISKVFPEYFAANKELLFRDLIKNYNDDASRYDLPKPMTFNEEQSLALAQGAKGKSKGGAGGVIGDITGSDSNNQLSEIVGQ
jgi:hypothetical protein